MMNSAAKIINFQLSMFGEFSKIQLDTTSNTDIVIKLLSALKDEKFLPEYQNIPSFDILRGKMNAGHRLQLVSSEKAWVISFIDNRIDFNYSNSGNNVTKQNIDSLIKYSGLLASKVFNVLSNYPQGNRLAVNLKATFGDMKDKELDKIARKFIIAPTKSYEKAYTDWNLNINSQDEMLISKDNKEICNRILGIMKYKYIDHNHFNNLSPFSNENQHQAMMLSFDINTLPKKLSPRFNKDDLISFANNAKSFLQTTTDEIWEKANEN